MRRGVIFGVLALAASLAACSDEPSGRWETTDRIEVLANKFDPETVLFHLEKGEICALSDKWHVKDQGYKKISCKKGRGWISNDEHFKKLGD
jgi:hypothetical protein